MTPDRPRACRVEWVDPSAPEGDGLPLLPRYLLIDGVQVSYVEQDTFEVRGGDHDNPLRVEMTLLPETVHVRGYRPTDPWRLPAPPARDLSITGNSIRRFRQAPPRRWPLALLALALLSPLWGIWRRWR